MLSAVVYNAEISSKRNDLAEKCMPRHTETTHPEIMLNLNVCVLFLYGCLFRVLPTTATEVERSVEMVQFKQIHS